METPKRKPPTPEGIAYGERVKAARLYAKLSQDDLAVAALCSQQNIGAIESGQHQSSSYTVRIAHACKVSCWWLETGEGGMLDSDIPMSQPERTLLIDYRAIDTEEGKSHVRANIRYWREVRSPGGGAKRLQRKRVTKPPSQEDARRVTKGRGNKGG